MQWWKQQFCIIWHMKESNNVHFFSTLQLQMTWKATIRLQCGSGLHVLQLQIGVLKIILFLPFTPLHINTVTFSSLQLDNMIINWIDFSTRLRTDDINDKWRWMQKCENYTNYLSKRIVAYGNYNNINCFKYPLRYMETNAFVHEVKKPCRVHQNGCHLGNSLIVSDKYNVKLTLV